MKCMENMKRITLLEDDVINMIKLYKYNGKEFYYNDVFKSDLDMIQKQVAELDSYYLAKWLEIPLTESRMKLLVKKNIVPKNKDEQLLVNIRRIMERLQKGIEQFEPIINDCHEMVKSLFFNVKDVMFVSRTKVDRNRVIPDRRVISRRDRLNDMLDKFNSLKNTEEHELTILVTNFYVDFLNEKPFKEENEFIGLMLMYILLFHSGFNQFKYTSFFSELLKIKKSFSKAILQASFNWEEGFAQTSPLHHLLVRVLLNGYKNIENQLRDYEFDKDLNKTNNIENTIMKLPEIFSKEDLRIKHPYVSDSTINRTLQRLRDEDKIRPMSGGRSAKWMRLYKTASKFSDYKQLGLFDFSEENKK